MRKIFIRFCKNIESFVMKSINLQGGFLFCAVGNFPKSVSVTSRLLERWEYLGNMCVLGPKCLCLYFPWLFPLEFSVISQNMNLQKNLTSWKLSKSQKLQNLDECVELISIIVNKLQCVKVLTLKSIGFTYRLDIKEGCNRLRDLQWTQSRDLLQPFLLDIQLIILLEFKGLVE